MNIVRLQAENVKRLSAVEITPEGNLVVLGGGNGQGKSSVLDSIEIALSGGVPPKMPVRRGEEKARIVVDLGEVIVKRTFTASGGTSLIVTNADGVKQASPQALLDKLAGKLTFDPLAFSRQNAAQQAETLRNLVGLDFSQQDAERDRLYAQRTEVNRVAKAKEALLKSNSRHEGVPKEEQSSAAILEAQKKALEQNEANRKTRVATEAFQGALSRTKVDIERLVMQIDELDTEIKRLTTKRNTHEVEASLLREKLAGQQEAATQESAKLANLQDVSLNQFVIQLSELESLNLKIRKNKQVDEIAAEFKVRTKESEDLTRKMEAIDAEKRKATQSAKWPIEGLSFDVAGGVTLGDIPFEQASSAEQLRVSVAIGIALNPKLRVLLIRDGSLLDEKSLSMVAQMAKDAQCQVWLERVGVDAATSVVIEDGRVKDAPSVSSTGEKELL